MMLMYKVRLWTTIEILKYDVERVTAKSVVLPWNDFWEKNPRELKRTADHAWFDNWTDAHAYAMEKIEKRLSNAELRVEGLRGEYQSIAAMTEPEKDGG